MDACLRGNGLRDLGLCKQIVEREKFNGVLMITTIWGKVDLGQARDRECEHYDTLQFWSDFHSGVLLGPFVQDQPPQSKSLRVLQTPVKD
jgi:hypothetical protein